MKNCIFKKQKSVIDNDSMEILGMAKFVSIVGATTLSLHKPNGVEIVIDCDNTDDVFSVSSSPITFPYTWGSSSTSISITGTTTKVTTFSVSDKYKINYVYAIGFASILPSANNFFSFTLPQTNIADFPFSNPTLGTGTLYDGLDLLKLDLSQCSGNFSIKSNIVPMNIAVFLQKIPSYSGKINFRGEILYGNINNLDISPNIPELIVRFNTTIEGIVERLIENLCVTRTSGTVFFDFRDSPKVTFDNKTVYHTVTFTATGATITSGAQAYRSGAYDKSSGTWTYA